MRPYTMLGRVLGLALPLVALAGAQKVGDSLASFQGKGPAGFKVEGKTPDLTLADDGTTLTVTVPLEHMETGIALRDRHLREKYVEVQKYPDATLALPWSAITLPADGKTVQAHGTGKLTLHGQTREVPFSATLFRHGAIYDVTGQVPINLKEFGISIPSYLGVTVQPDITTTVTFHATRS